MLGIRHRVLFVITRHSAGWAPLHPHEQDSPQSQTAAKFKSLIESVKNTIIADFFSFLLGGVGVGEENEVSWCSSG